MFVNCEQGLFLSVYVDDRKSTGKKQNIDPVWKILMKEVRLGEATSFLDHVCATSTDIVDNYRNMFESQISAASSEALLHLDKRDANISS